MSSAYGRTEPLKFWSLQADLVAVHKTILQEFYQVAFRKKLYGNLEELQTDLDVWITYYYNERTHQGKMCCGRTPMETLHDGKTIWKEKNVA